MNTEPFDRPTIVSNRQMRAAVLTGPGKLEIRRTRLPDPGPREVRVRLEGCGVCGSNLAAWEGRPWFTYPLEPGAPGHEGWGVIDATGLDVDRVKPGERVALLSHHAFAEYDLAPEEAVVPLPLALNGTPCPGEPLGYAMNVFSRSEIRPGQTVAILGIGFLGALLANLASQAGARVIALSRRAYALELAREVGAAETIPLDDQGRMLEQVRDLTGGEFCDTVIEATGLQWPLDLAGELAKVRGRVVVAGYHQDGLRQINMQLWNGKEIDVINAHEREPGVYPKAVRDAFNAIALGWLNPEPLFTHSFSLEELPAAFETLRTRPSHFLKACVTFT